MKLDLSKGESPAIIKTGSNSNLCCLAKWFDEVRSPGDLFVLFVEEEA